MNDTLTRVQMLVERGQVRISEHGYDELADDGILVGDVLAGVAKVLLSKTIWMIQEAHPC